MLGTLPLLSTQGPGVVDRPFLKSNCRLFRPPASSIATSGLSFVFTSFIPLTHPIQQTYSVLQLPLSTPLKNPMTSEDGLRSEV